MQTSPDPSTLHQTSGQLLHLFCADLDLAAAMPFFADRFTDASEDACSLLAVRQETDRFPDVTFPPLCITLDVEQYYVWRNVPPVLCRSPRPFSAAVSRYQHGGLFMRRTAFARQRFLPPTYWTAPPFFIVDALSLGGLAFGGPRSLPLFATRDAHLTCVHADAHLTCIHADT